MYNIYVYICIIYICIIYICIIYIYIYVYDIYIYMYNIYIIYIYIYICKYIKHNYYLPRLKIHVWLAISRGSPKNRLGAEAVQGTGLKLRKPKKGECHLASLKRLVGFIGEVFFSGTPCFFSMKFTETIVFPCFCPRFLAGNHGFSIFFGPWKYRYLM